MHKTTSYISSNKNSQEIEKIVGNILGDEKDKYAVAIENLKTGEKYFLNEEKVFETASLYKLWVMVVAFEKIEKGELDESLVLSAEIKDLNEKFNIASESAELTEGSVSWPVSNAIEKMISFSDNYSALLLSQQIGLSSVDNFLKRNQFNQSKIGTKDSNPVTSARDIESFFKKIYLNEFLSYEKNQRMLRLLKDQRINGKLPRYLPEKTVIAHKTGELGEFSHDAGIVYTDYGDYLIVVLSQTGNQKNANEKISKISKEIYDYFFKK